jgi:GDPmannose 4,6-dehydratase
MWKILQLQHPTDLVIATGIQITVRQFIEKCCEYLKMPIEWKGEGINEVGIHEGRIIVQVDQKYFRPSEVDNLLGDPSKAKELLDWDPQIDLETLIKRMLDNDLKIAKMEVIYSQSNL